MPKKNPMKHSNYNKSNTCIRSFPLNVQIPNKILNPIFNYSDIHCYTDPLIDYPILSAFAYTRWSHHRNNSTRLWSHTTPIAGAVEWRLLLRSKPPWPLRQLQRSLSAVMTHLMVQISLSFPGLPSTDPVWQKIGFAPDWYQSVPFQA